MPCWSDPHAQATAETQKQGGVYSLSGDLRRMSPERSLYSVSATFREPSPLRWRVRANAAAGHAHRDAAAKINCRASVWHAEIPNLWTSAFPAARSWRSADRSLSGNHGLQPQTDDEG